MQFIMLDGANRTGPGSRYSLLFAENMQAIYGAAYTLKFPLSCTRKTRWITRSWRSKGYGGSRMARLTCKTRQLEIHRHDHAA